MTHPSREPPVTNPRVRDDGHAPRAGDTLLHESPGGLLWRRTKVGILQARRLLSWTVQPTRWRPPPVSSLPESATELDQPAGYRHCIYHRDVPIARADDGADPVLERGKRVNLRIAAPHFHGLTLSAQRPLSFWRALGRATARRGFRHGMELRGGCIVPTLGGGLCLLSNALFRMACELGWTILQRHGHTIEAVPDDHPVWGLDATVFWPHVDLCIAPRAGRALLGVEVVGEALRIRVYSRSRLPHRVVLRSVGDVTYRRHGQPVRANCVTRELYDIDTGRLHARDVVANNRRRLLHTDEMRRNCLTCDESGCHARPRDLPAGHQPLVRLHKRV